jgi:hypothetical protein
MIINLQEVKESGRLYSCQECKKNFPASEIATTELKNFKLSPESEVLHTEDGKILTCPRCNRSHPYGFSPGFASLGKDDSPNMGILRRAVDRIAENTPVEDWKSK